MADLECPYCNKEIDICHDDGFGYQEGVKHQYECHHCNKSFVFETSLSYYYEAEKAECLNNGAHDYQLTKTFPKEFSKMRCSICGKEREMTDEERVNFKIGTKQSYMDTLRNPCR